MSCRSPYEILGQFVGVMCNGIHLCCRSPYEIRYNYHLSCVSHLKEVAVLLMRFFSSFKSLSYDVNVFVAVLLMRFFAAWTQTAVDSYLVAVLLMRFRYNSENI